MPLRSFYHMPTRVSGKEHLSRVADTDIMTAAIRDHLKTFEGAVLASVIVENGEGTDHPSYTDYGYLVFTFSDGRSIKVEACDTASQGTLDIEFLDESQTDHEAKLDTIRVVGQGLDLLCR